MWGLNWGQMIWGQATPVPALGFWGLMVLLAALGGLGLRRLRGGRPRLLGGLALVLALLVPISARALPFTFTNGTVADANQVNANFAALASAQAIGPSASSNLVDLFGNNGATCEGVGMPPTTRTFADGSSAAFSIPAGQTLIVTRIEAIWVSTPQNAGQELRIGVDRVGSGKAFGSSVDSTTVALDPGGSAHVRFDYPTGTAFGPGTQLCVTSPGLPASQVSAHGYLTTQ
jgi:hypothetical protein